MLHPGCPLSVVVATCRPKWLANCLAQFASQRRAVRTELVVVAEGDAGDFTPVVEYFSVRRFYSKKIEGNAGSFAKDYGVLRATGEYVAFWDDDNVYHDDALQTLYGASRGYDIGVARAVVMGRGFLTVPLGNRVKLTEIDTMCFCVRRSLAVRERWSAHLGRGTDYFWLKRLLAYKPTVNYSDKVVGIHLDEGGR